MNFMKYSTFGLIAAFGIINIACAVSLTNEEQECVPENKVLAIKDSHIESQDSQGNIGFVRTRTEVKRYHDTFSGESEATTIGFAPGLGVKLIPNISEMEKEEDTEEDEIVEEVSKKRKHSNETEKSEAQKKVRPKKAKAKTKQISITSDSDWNTGDELEVSNAFKKLKNDIRTIRNTLRVVSEAIMNNEVAILSNKNKLAKEAGEDVEDFSIPDWTIERGAKPVHERLLAELNEKIKKITAKNLFGISIDNYSHKETGTLPINKEKVGKKLRAQKDLFQKEINEQLEIIEENKISWKEITLETGKTAFESIQEALENLKKAVDLFLIS